MKIHQLSPGEALKSLKSSHDGLSQNEALRRLKEFGPNQIDKVQSWPHLFKQTLSIYK